MKVDKFARARYHYIRRGYLLFGRAEGYVTTRRPIKQDLFGILDAVAVGLKGTVGIQICSLDSGDMSRHRTKLTAAEFPAQDGGIIISKALVPYLKECGWKIELFATGWSDKDCKFVDRIEEF